MSQGKKYAQTTEEEHARMIRLRRKGKSFRQIARQTGRAYSTVHRILKRAGVDMGKRGGSTR
jgi:IS30 family transposase